MVAPIQYGYTVITDSILTAEIKIITCRSSIVVSDKYNIPYIVGIVSMLGSNGIYDRWLFRGSYMQGKGHVLFTARRIGRKYDVFFIEFVISFIMQPPCDSRAFHIKDFPVKIASYVD